MRIRPYFKRFFIYKLPIKNTPTIIYKKIELFDGDNELFKLFSYIGALNLSLFQHSIARFSPTSLNRLKSFACLM